LHDKRLQTADGTASHYVNRETLPGVFSAQNYVQVYNVQIATNLHNVLLKW